MFNFVPPSGDFLLSEEATGWVERLFAQLESPEFAAEFARETKLMEDADEDDFMFFNGSSLRPYNVVDGTLIVPVRGMLMAGLPYALGSMATGYEYITAAVATGARDPQVDDILLRVNSPGGTVPGCFDCADSIFNLRGTKPIRAIADEAAYSAGYAIASSADSLQVARTGGVGSIGARTTHRDFSAALSQRGIKETTIISGKHKNDGDPAQPLSDQARAHMQARIDHINDVFVSTVARNRDMDEQAVRDTQAASYMAHEAVELGLADTVGPLGTMSAKADPTNENLNEDENMTTPKNPDTVTLAERDAAVAEATKLAVAEAMTRTRSILDSEEGVKRPKQARHVALNTDWTLEVATAFLKDCAEEGAAPALASDGDEAATAAAAAAAAEKAKTEAAAAAAAFAAGMNGNNPDLGAGDDSGGGSEDDEVAFLADFRAARGTAAK